MAGNVARGNKVVEGVTVAEGIFRRVIVVVDKEGLAVGLRVFCFPGSHQGCCNDR